MDIFKIIFLISFPIDGYFSFQTTLCLCYQVFNFSLYLSFILLRFPRFVFYLQIPLSPRQIHFIVSYQFYCYPSLSFFVIKPTFLPFPSRCQGFGLTLDSNKPNNLKIKIAMSQHMPCYLVCQVQGWISLYPHGFSRFFRQILTTVVKMDDDAY